LSFCAIKPSAVCCVISKIFAGRTMFHRK
jgi:hypothetical protein